MKKIFLRRDSARFSKFGKRRKKLLGWKRPKGRDNKMREKRRGYASVVSIGYSSDKEKVNKIKEKTPIQIKNTKDLNKIQKDNIGIVGRVGKKKKIEIAKKAKEMKIELYNLNPKLILKKSENKGEISKNTIKNETK
jgi:large subunit ribosomal protein L32e